MKKKVFFCKTVCFRIDYNSLLINLLLNNNSNDCSTGGPNLSKNIL